jgi:hypothetical protein
VACTVLLMTGVYGFFNSAKQSYSSGLSGANLQDGANLVISKIVEGESESGVVYRLSTAMSYMVPSGIANYMYTCGGIPQTAPCNVNWPFGELYYCQDSPCTSGDATRWYYLNSNGTAVMYHHPKTGGGFIDETLYQIPSGSNTSMSLRFSYPAFGNPAVTSSTVVQIDVGIRQNLSAPTAVANTRSSTTSGSGAATTLILLRNHT